MPRPPPALLSPTLNVTNLALLVHLCYITTATSSHKWLRSEYKRRALGRAGTTWGQRNLLIARAAFSTSRDGLTGKPYSYTNLILYTHFTGY